MGIISTWSFILICQIRMRKLVNSGEIESAGFCMPGAPYTAWLTLGFLGFVVVLMALDYPEGTYTVIAIPFIGVLLALGWGLILMSRRRA